MTLSSKSTSISSLLDAELITATLFCLLGLVGLWLVNTPWFWHQVWVDKGGILMGEVVRKSGEVRYRPQGIPLWMDVLQGERTQAYSGGAVFAGPGAAATLDLMSGPLLELEENSLVLLEVSSQGDAKLALGESNIKLTFRGKGDAVVLVAGGQSIRVVSKKKGMVLDAAMQGGKLKSAALESEDFEVTRLAVAEAPPQVDTETIGEAESKPTVTPTLPTVVATTTWWSRDEGEDKLRIEIPHGGKVRLMAGEDEIADRVTEQGPAVFLLNEDEAAKVKAYAVEGVGKGDIQVEWGAPTITKAVNEKGKVFIVWRKTVFTRAYIVALCRDSLCKEVVKTETTAKNFLALKGMPMRPTWVRIRSEYKAGHGQWSEILKLAASPRQ